MPRINGIVFKNIKKDDYLIHSGYNFDDSNNHTDVLECYKTGEGNILAFKI
jgi:hypothetical protein